MIRKLIVGVLAVAFALVLPAVCLGADQPDRVLTVSPLVRIGEVATATVTVNGNTEAIPVLVHIEHASGRTYSAIETAAPSAAGGSSLTATYTLPYGGDYRVWATMGDWRSETLLTRCNAPALTLIRPVGATYSFASPARISGILRDASGRPLASQAVHLVRIYPGDIGLDNAETVKVRSLVTDGSGRVSTLLNLFVWRWRDYRWAWSVDAGPDRASALSTEAVLWSRTAAEGATNGDPGKKYSGQVRLVARRRYQLRFEPSSMTASPTFTLKSGTGRVVFSQRITNRRTPTVRTFTVSKSGTYRYSIVGHGYSLSRWAIW